MNDKINVIVSGHGKFATGMQGALHLLTKIPDTFQFVDFEEGLSDDDLRKKFQAILNEHAGEQILFFTDLLGGTPYKVAAEFAVKSDNTELVAGCNLGSLLETIYMQFDSASALADALVTYTKSGIDKFSMDTATTSDNNTNDFADGI
ncbi:PTS system, N-acetylgalactosamine- and galactosamine-specific IIA component [Pediococcus damnosus]|uniref:PTS system, N-acetylgalactosamine-and galactosamine-specific IIA component n=1 Tax=Pediococcus damnosus TaxID=51663 RepID=A0A0R2HEW1_9LACO|nr:PTS sugar transporter subunit IIA [Pediococcus damnosus]AMV60983.1 PTS system, N-acetylgalactosamine- and galactosamine-specific IIA component [Pediococcus damnosus]AMV63554.1 PTS system, N-acetylgalactosamine- and galactosamine-specific IIA component [Pediococcus damnosus]AMV65343.1 PTS system, N-acetylgalactosamine- and galactosamine-specific IIA component [Pediococcus damnosus]AMV66506.1 PTS system, N-acetylgalactosamine- and galactosamine-specific IIA component [Pediococcus damnosus]AMV